MRQRALEDGVLSDPYQYVKAGEEFDRPTLRRWAVSLEPEKKPAPRRKSEPEPVAGSEDEII